MYLTGVKFQMLVLLSAFIILGTELAANKIHKVNLGWFSAALATLVVAFAFSISDGQRIWCEPTNHGWFAQGHAIWHWVAALAMFMIYKHFSQDKLSPQT